MKAGTLRLALWGLVALAAAGAAFLALRPPPPVANVAETQAMGTVGGPFTLTGTDGKTFSSSSLAGKPRAMFFGFTHCPDVCPTTLSRLAKLRRDVGGDDAFQIVFVSVDPERDTPAEMAKYVKLFDTPIIALTGTPAAVDRVKKLYGIYGEKVPTGNGDYTVDHSAAVLLFDAHDDFIGTITPEESLDAQRAKVKRLAA